MFKIHLPLAINKYEIEELIRIFLKSGEYQILGPEEEAAAAIDPEAPEDGPAIEIRVPVFPKTPDPSGNERELKNQIKRFLFRELQRHTGETPDWGTLTGVRPVKLAGELLLRYGTVERAEEALLREHFLTKEKARLLMDIVTYQKNVLNTSPAEAVGLYVGIPFCPTRCVYCSFPSNQGKEQDISSYLTALHREISYTAEKMKGKGWYPETVYIGGGTPTTLTAEQLDELLGHIVSEFDLTRLREFTVEAGRPDTITPDKLRVIKEYGVQRISINPQSMNEMTLARIGRKHGPEEIGEAFRLAREAGISMINADVIAGLPGESPEDFVYTLERVLAFAPENITVHTLALKRASKLKEIDGEYNYKQGKQVRAMLDRAKEMLFRSGYEPYYLYRQKQMTGNFENVGYAKGNTAGIYNIRIMEEAQTIIALGAGGISKVYYPEENRLERVPNVSNYQLYIERLDEMLQRKEENLFRGGKEC